MLGGHLDGWLPDGHPAAVRGERRQPGLPGLVRPRGDAAGRARLRDRGRGQAAEVPHRLRSGASGGGHQDRHRRGGRVRRGGVPGATSQQVNPGVEVVLTSARPGRGRRASLLDRAPAVADGGAVHTPVMASTAPSQDGHAHGARSAAHRTRMHDARTPGRRTRSGRPRRARPRARLEPVATSAVRRRSSMAGACSAGGSSSAAWCRASVSGRSSTPSPPGSGLAGHVDQHR